MASHGGPGLRLEESRLGSQGRRKGFGMPWVTRRVRSGGLARLDLGVFVLARSIACAIEARIVPALPFSCSRRAKAFFRQPALQTAASAGEIAARVNPSRSGETYCWR